MTRPTKEQVEQAREQVRAKGGWAAMTLKAEVRAHGPLEAKVVEARPTKPRPPDPTPEMLESPEFEAVWQVIKGWDVDHGGGMRSGATGNDVRAILDALKAVAP